MFLIWKPMLLIAAALLLFAAFHTKQPAVSKNAVATEDAATISPPDFMHWAGRLPETVVEHYQ